MGKLRSWQWQLTWLTEHRLPALHQKHCQSADKLPMWRQDRGNGGALFVWLPISLGSCILTHSEAITTICGYSPSTKKYRREKNKTERTCCDCCCDHLARTVPSEHQLTQEVHGRWLLVGQPWPWFLDQSRWIKSGPIIDNFFGAKSRTGLTGPIVIV